MRIDYQRRDHGYQGCQSKIYIQLHVVDVWVYHSCEE